ncbi:hypothetical protein FRB95_009552 [Tulasnella sp. JGI-2019a]|nr:hypothetical protein FRB95_009552 [Tulasnella sp. JGI-2019a]
MQSLPSEIFIAIINALTSDTHAGAYTYTSEVKDALRNLALVNHAYYQWSSSLLYRRVTVTGDQIAQLVATLSGSGTTPRTQSLAERVRSLRLVAVYPIGWELDPQDPAENKCKAVTLLHILARTTAFQRLFVDADIASSWYRKTRSSGLTHTCIDPDLHATILSLKSLSELVLRNKYYRTINFFWNTLPRCNRLSGLRVLTVVDIAINDPRMINLIQTTMNLKELVLIRPWIDCDFKEVGCTLANLFAPPWALQHLTIVLGNGWEGWRLEDLGSAMGPHLDKVDIFSEGDPQDLSSWVNIGDLIGMGHRWSWRI